MEIAKDQHGSSNQNVSSFTHHQIPQFKTTSTIFSPIKDYNPFDTPQLKTEIKLTSLNSPFVPNITPAKIDWFMQNNNNNETPINASRIFSPFISANQNKVSYQNFHLVQKNLLTEFSPQILFSSPNKIMSLSTLDREIPKE